jgi:hypothetical protein
VHVYLTMNQSDKICAAALNVDDLSEKDSPAPSFIDAEMQWSR